MGRLVEKLSKCCDYFLRFSAFLITFKFSQLDYLTMLRKSSVNKTVYFFLVSLKYREVITVKTVTLYKKFSQLDYLTMLRKSSVNKTVYFFLVSLKYREVITVKTVTLYKKVYLFIKRLKSKKKKLVLTLFDHVSRVRQLKKACLHRPIKILHFLTLARIQKCFT